MAQDVHDSAMNAVEDVNSPPVELSVLIVNWNSKDFLQRCLESLFRECNGTSIEIIVIDSASYDGCEIMLKTYFPTVVFLQAEQNLGFAKANNYAALSARGEFLLLLNPDTFFQENTIERMIRGFRQLPEDAGALGCRLLNADGSLQDSCVQAYPTIINQVFDSAFLRQRFPSWNIWGTGALYNSSGADCEVDAISGACILIKRDTFLKVGGFTEAFFMYSEDIDLCFKIAQLGKAIYYTSNTILIHYGGASSEKAASNFSTVMLRKSIFQYFIRNRGVCYAYFYRVAMFINASLRLLFLTPLLIFGQSIVKHGHDSKRKWLAVLKWSIGVEGGL